MARKKGICFVVMPFGTKPVGKVKVDFDRVYAHLIEPAAEAAGFKAIRADTSDASGSITGSFLNQLYNADIVVADITYPNANVFYELGVRHALRKFGTVALRLVGGNFATARNGVGQRPPIVPLPIPFDVRDLTVLDVDLTKQTLEARKTELTDRILGAASQDTTDSPVFTHVQGLRVEKKLAAASGRQDRTFEVVGAPGRFIGYRSGDICNLKGAEAIDYWVSSENTQMIMARTVERSVSSSVRYFGARDPNPLSPAFEDTIADALKAAMGNKHVVGEGDVLVTTSGRLADTHGVKALLHAATVTAVYGRGFESISDGRLAECVGRVLENARALARGVDPDMRGRSVVMPIFGAGQAGRDPTQISGLLISAALTKLQEFGPNPAADDINLVVFCAYTQAEVDLLRRIFDRLEKDGDIRGAPKSAVPGDET